jgi:signal transduction histidine kinase
MIAVTGIAAIATISEFGVPGLRLRYVSSELRVALEMAQTLIALLATHLLYGRFRRTRLLGDLLLAYGMGLFGAANLFFVIVPIVHSAGGLLVYQTWAPLLVRLVGAVPIVVAAWSRPRHYDPPKPAIQLLLAHVITSSVVLAAVGAFSGHLPAGVEASLSSTGGAPKIEGHPVLLGAQVVLMAMHWITAVGFARTARKGDALALAFAVAFLLGGFSRLNFFLYPSVYTSVVQTGDILRLSCYLALLVGAEREINSYWSGRVGAAVTEERRRTARELHDGLVQELSFIRSRTSSFTGAAPDPLTLQQVAGAAERALAESRLALQALSGERTDAPVDVLRQAAEEVAIRAGAQVEVHAPDGFRLSPAVTEALGRIVREASSNAVRHGKAQTVSLRVERRQKSGLCLTVVDDGAGFRPELDTSATGFGLTSMRERARALGGELTVVSSPGRGTRVEVTVPRA